MKGSNILVSKGLYRVHHKDEEYLVRVVGTAPMLVIDGCINLKKFREAGELCQEEEFPKKLTVAPQDYVYFPVDFIAEKAVDKQSKNKSNTQIEYSKDDLNYFAQLANNKYKCITEIMIRKQWTLNQAGLFYEKILKHLTNG